MTWKIVCVFLILYHGLDTSVYAKENEKREVASGLAHGQELSLLLPRAIKMLMTTQNRAVSLAISLLYLPHRPEYHNFTQKFQQHFESVKTFQPSNNSLFIPQLIHQVKWTSVFKDLVSGIRDLKLPLPSQIQMALQFTQMLLYDDRFQIVLLNASKVAMKQVYIRQPNTHLASQMIASHLQALVHNRTGGRVTIPFVDQILVFSDGQIAHGLTLLQRFKDSNKTVETQLATLVQLILPYFARTNETNVAVVKTYLEMAKKGKIIKQVDDAAYTIWRAFTHYQTSNKTLEDLEPIFTIAQGAAVRSLPLVAQWIGKPTNVSAGCWGGLVTLTQGLLQKEIWALKIIDSWGKVRSGILTGQLDFPGRYRECVEIHDNVDSPRGETVRGGYCHWSLSPQKTAHLGLKLGLGTCTPTQCTENDLMTLLNGVFPHIDVDVTGVECSTPLELADEPVAVGVITFLCVSGALVLLTTLLDAFYLTTRPQESEVNGTCGQNGTSNGLVRLTLSKAEDAERNGESATMLSEGRNGGVHDNTHHEGSKVTKKKCAARNIITGIIRALSLYTNLPKLLNTKQAAGSITCVHGLRFWSMAWIILGHTYFFLLTPGPGSFHVGQIVLLKTMPTKSHFWDRINMYFIIAGQYGVDSFFVFSGFLVAYLFLSRMEKEANSIKKCIRNIFQSYLHRYLRLTPLYLVIIVIFADVFPVMGKGPFWSNDNEPASQCRQYWWRNILYINNFFPSDQMCLGWSWYIANDMQFCLISPFILLFFVLSPAIGVTLICVLILGSIVASGVIFHDIRSSSPVQVGFMGHGDYFDRFYDKPWTRFNTYGIGMLAAYAVLKLKQRKPMHWAIALSGWLASTTLALVLLFVEYDSRCSTCVSWQPWRHEMWESLRRPLWALVLSWIIVACSSKSGGVINMFLSWPGYVPLSKLTYAAYLVHPVVMLVFYFNRHETVYIQDFTMVVFFFGYMCLSYAVAMVFFLFFESPVMALEKLVLPRKRSHLRH